MMAFLCSRRFVLMVSHGSNLIFLALPGLTRLDKPTAVKRLQGCIVTGLHRYRVASLQGCTANELIGGWLIGLIRFILFFFMSAQLLQAC